MARLIVSVAFLLGLLTTVLTVPAQITSGTLFGTVTDSSGAAIVGATVTAENVDTGARVNVTTDDGGGYRFQALPPGTYVVRVQASSFAVAKVPAVAIAVAETVRLPISLQVGGETGEAPKKKKKAAKHAAKDSWKGGETGRDFLVKGNSEAPGYGLYSYVLLSGRPTEESKPRYLATIRACLDQIETVEGLEGSGIPKAKLNIAYIPISLKPSSQRVDEQWVLDNYDYDRAATLLLYLPKRFARHEGPYLVSHGAPLADDSQGEFLYQDLSVANPRLATAWIKYFLDRASQEQFWETNRTQEFALDLRNFVADAAPDIDNIKSAVATWIQTFSK